MTREVLVSVSGLQFGTEVDNDPVEVITGGNYYKKKDKHYVMYDEIMEGISGVTKNTFKFDKNTFNLIKTGAVNVNMLFEENKRNLTNYETPFGSMLIGIDTNAVEVLESQDLIHVDIDYAIDINYEHLADCKIALDIKSKSDHLVKEEAS